MATDNLFVRVGCPTMTQESMQFISLQIKQGMMNFRVVNVQGDEFDAPSKNIEGLILVTL